MNHHWGIVLVGIGLAIASPGAAIANTVSKVEMICPYDGRKFSFTRQNSGTSFDKTLDLRPLGAVISPWPIAVCPTNGFVFLKGEYTPDELETLRPLILSPEYQALKDETGYYRAAWIADRTGMAEEASWLLLQACWEVAEQPARFKRYAGELLNRLPREAAAQSDPKRRLMANLLIGEMQRRLGHFDQAQAHFTALGQELREGPELRIVGYQLGLIAARDSGQHKLSEAFGLGR